MRAADILARRLHDAGCRYAFGIPGGEVLTILDALDKAGITFILSKHENSAGFMAEGVFQRTGAPGILVATLGPGAANAVNVVANAEQDRVPLIVLTGCVDEDEAHTYTHQVLDHGRLFAPVVKETFRLSAPCAGIIADKALSVALEERQGPVHIDVPISTAPADTDARSITTPASPETAPAEGQTLDLARSWLSDARRPIIMAGLDVMAQGASADVAAFARRHRVPVVTTYKAKGVLPENEPLAVGGAGLSPVVDGHFLPLVKESDCILALGYDPIEMRTGWRDPWDETRQRVIEVAPVANRHHMHRSTVFFRSSIAPTLAALENGGSPAGHWPSERLTEIRESVDRELARTEEWGPSAVIDTARRETPTNAIAAVDSGAHRILLNQLWHCYEPRSLLQSTGLCTMGCAVPLALGAKIADPAKPAIAFVGDAGLLMFLGELATIAEVGLPVAIVVFVDRSLALIELKQRRMQYPNTGVDFGLCDYPAIARGLGGEGVDVTSRSELADALRKAFDATTFTVIACHIDRQSYDGRI